MSDKYLHIIMHDVPYPADFGGVVDLFYKIVWLHKTGIKIKLHCFINKREKQDELNKYCETVYYYKRKKVTGISFTIPYIVSSRKSKTLLQHLLEDDHPILMEGIHCSYYVEHPSLSNRKMFLRLHNVEHKYYEQLAKYESNLFKKWYYQLEAGLLKKYEQRIADKLPIWTVSTEDALLYKELFNAKNIRFIPVFLPFDGVNILINKGRYCLYHGNLAINENEKAAYWLIENVFKHLKIPLIIAGRNPGKKLKSAAAGHQFVSIVANPSAENLHLLIQHAQVNVLPSFNKTGVKLKLLNALYNGKHCLVNLAGAEGSGLNELCHIAEDDSSFKESLINLFSTDFTVNEMQYRRTALKSLYNNSKNAEFINKLL